MELYLDMWLTCEYTYSYILFRGKFDALLAFLKQSICIMFHAKQNNSLYGSCFNSTASKFLSSTQCLVVPSQFREMFALRSAHAV